jgi:long-chain acyl-CoA synthetase
MMHRPWLSVYPTRLSFEVGVEHANLVEMFRTTCARDSERAAIKYFDGAVSFGGLDELSDSLAVGMAERGVARGDRVAVYLQNVPQFVITLLACWKLGAIAVSANPMNRHRELAELLSDSGAKALVCLESLYSQVAREVVGDTAVELVVTTSELEYQSRNDERLFAGSQQVRHSGTVDMSELIAAHRGQHPPPVEPSGNDVAVLTYTSGTTGPPKGAMNTHANITFTAQIYRDWTGLPDGGAILGVAPLFHVTGLIGHVALSLLTGNPLILVYRFDPHVILEAIREHRPAFTVGAITVFTALLNTPGLNRKDFTSLASVCSGGSPVSPATVRAFEAATGVRIRPIYGLTETTSPSHMPPPGIDAPVDPQTGAYSVGVPVSNTTAWIEDEHGSMPPPGEAGEIVIAGPQVVPGYWGKPGETEHALPGGNLHTGDVGIMDSHGWFYIVDRRKDQINAAGYKVWPREVEDVLYEHPAVREAAVVGVPDPYRGETVAAFVSLIPGTQATPEELTTFAKDRLAAYKYPRHIEILDELPKTVSGKILRRTLRAQAQPA